MNHDDKDVVRTGKLSEDDSNQPSEVQRREKRNRESSEWDPEEAFSPPPFGRIPDYMPPGPMLIPPADCLMQEKCSAGRESIPLQQGRKEEKTNKGSGTAKQTPYIWSRRPLEQGNIPYKEQIYGGSSCCGQGMSNQNPAYPLPFYMTYPLPMFGEEEDTVYRDLEYLQQIYPDKAKRYQIRISRFLDTMDYDGSLIYDEYPDRLGMYRLAGVISERIQKEEMPDIQNSEEVRRQWEADKELIHILMYYEIYRRRHSRRWLNF